MYNTGSTALLTFEQAYEGYYSYVFNNAVRMLNGNVEIAEDLASDVWEIACRSWSQFNQKSTGGWLVTILRNKVCDYFRYGKRFVGLEEQYGYTNGDSYHAAEDLVDLGQSFITLNKSEKEAIVCKANGLSDNDASLFLRITINAYRVRLHKARRKLKEIRNG